MKIGVYLKCYIIPTYDSVLSVKECAETRKIVGSQNESRNRIYKRTKGTMRSLPLLKGVEYVRLLWEGQPRKKVY